MLHLPHACSLLLLVLAGLAAPHADAQDRPNIVLLFADDLRFDAVGYTGNPVIATPHLDALAARGQTYNQCFVNTSICAISRANILIGQTPSAHGIDDFFKTFSTTQLAQTFPAQLRDAGYQTAFFGKWGIGDTPAATDQGAVVFDYWAGQPHQTSFYHEPDCRYVQADGFARPTDSLCDCPLNARGDTGPANRSGAANLAGFLHVDSQVTPRHVRRFLDGRDPDRPFCLAVFFKAPHSPFPDWDRRLIDLYTDTDMPVPAGATLALADAEPAVVRNSLGAPSGRRYLTDPPFLQQHLRDYYRLVTSMDLGVGAIVADLQARGLADNTVFLFTSDNGHFKGEHGLAGKWLMYDPSHRVPGFIMDPRTTPVAPSTDAMVTTVDFTATIYDLAGLPVPPHVLGESLVPLLTDAQPDGWRTDVLYEHPYVHDGSIPHTVGVRDARYTYTRYLNTDPLLEQLFDDHADPLQANNLATDPAHADRLNDMRARTDALLEAAASPGSTP